MIISFFTLTRICGENYESIPQRKQKFLFIKCKRTFGNNRINLQIIVYFVTYKRACCHRILSPHFFVFLRYLQVLLTDSVPNLKLFLFASLGVRSRKTRRFLVSAKSKWNAETDTIAVT